MGPFKNATGKQNDILPAVDFFSPGAVKDKDMIRKFKIKNGLMMFEWYNMEMKIFQY